ncbi:putative lipoprotein [Myxococcus hansupus]|uniref:Putative lipoprotein n=1 Tax=Pseudomyxococcus hansupus TaxID=1297742 RepID=A0A0H4X9M4_9BACT|nr:hypothetical protein [Myxococcus hansupus]AKQ64562.1 putative lipoprotein [Myxococcus hansupus]
MRVARIGAVLAGLIMAAGCGGTEAMQEPGALETHATSEQAALVTCEDCHTTYTACLRRARGDFEEVQVCVEQRHECTVQYCP